MQIKEMIIEKKARKFVVFYYEKIKIEYTPSKLQDINAYEIPNFILLWFIFILHILTILKIIKRKYIMTNHREVTLVG